jgi:murein DD-endopeptidase MepM/ murein hydrolase activator NlpD
MIGRGGDRTVIGWWPRLGVVFFAVSAAIVTATTPPAGLTVVLSSQRAATGWQWPLRPVPNRVVRDFNPPPQPWLAGNRGIDLAGVPGEVVRSAGSGVVSFAGQIAHVGVVSVTSGALRTTYEPLRARVHRGQLVASGTVLGRLTLAGSHCPPAACLHWGLLRGSAYLDPLALLGLEQVRLLPLN